MESLEERIGYQFSDPSFLQKAMTHPSLAYETKRPQADNQRLEFLGDAVIQLILTDELFQRFPKFSEGHLTKLRSRLVSRDALFELGKIIEIGQHLLLGKGEDLSGGRERPSNLADAIEALAGAIYLDGGLQPARAFIHDNFSEFIEKVAAKPVENNPKGQLQEKLQALKASSPKYSVLSQEGPDHEKTFVSEVRWEGIRLGKGVGTSKKEAETNAALEALQRERWKGEEKGEQVQNNCE